MNKINWNKLFPEYTRNADWETNAKSIMHYLAKSNEFLKIMAKRIEEYDETLDLTLEQISNRLESYIEENDDLMTERLEQWDLNLEKFPENVELLLQEWLSDGTLDHIINETIFNWKADKTYVDELNENVTAQLAQTEKKLYFSVTDFGADGSDAENDYEAIMQAYEKAVEIGGIVYFPKNDQNFIISETLLFEENVSVIMDGTLEFVGSNDKPALIIGKSGQDMNGVNHTLRVVNNSFNNWSDSRNVGITLINQYQSNINIFEVRGFTTGVKCIGSERGFAYNTIFLYNLQDNMTSFLGTNELGGWFNENKVFAGRFWVVSSTNTNKSRYGVVITSEDMLYTNNNANTFFAPSFELRNPTQGEVIPILIEHGSMNEFINCRNESNGQTFVRFENDSQSNHISTSYGGLNSSFVDDNSTQINTYEELRRKGYKHAREPISLNSDLANKIVEVEGIMTSDGFFFSTSSNSDISKTSASGITVNKEKGYVSIISTRNIGKRVNSSNVKTFVIDRSYANNNEGRLALRLYDQGGNILMTDELSYYSFSTFYFEPNYAGGVWRTAVDSNPRTFRVPENCKYFDVLFSEGDLTTLNIYSVNGLTNAYNPLS